MFGGKRKTTLFGMHIEFYFIIRSIITHRVDVFSYSTLQYI